MKHPADDASDAALAMTGRARDASLALERKILIRQARPYGLGAMRAGRGQGWSQAAPGRSQAAPSRDLREPGVPLRQQATRAWRSETPAPQSRSRTLERDSHSRPKIAAISPPCRVSVSGTPHASAMAPAGSVPNGMRPMVIMYMAMIRPR